MYLHLDESAQKSMSDAEKNIYRGIKGYLIYKNCTFIFLN